MAPDITVQQVIGTQNVYNEVHVNSEMEPHQEEDSISAKAELIPEFSADQFLRSAWITLAKEDAPIEVFSQDFQEIKQIEHQVVSDHIEYDVDYQASIGYDREESYITTEKYYEDQPYIAYEKQYNRTTGQYEERQVTKYKKVQKERPVTKYKTVTDWHPVSGTYHGSSLAIAENIKGLYLDIELFNKSFVDISLESISPIKDDEAASINLSEYATSFANTKHAFNIRSSVESSLQGDHSQDLDLQNLSITGKRLILYKTSEYQSHIVFDGKPYLKRAFPLGSMPIGGDRIPNNDDLDSVTEKMEQELDEAIKKRKETTEETIKKTTTGISIATIALLALSIIVSCFVHVMPLVIIAFVLAVAAFVFNTVFVNKKDKEEHKKEENEISELESKVTDEIVDYSINYRVKRLNALNNKLQSLGLNPVSADEMSQEEEEK